MFFILFVIHLFFVNWKTFLNYIRSKIRSGLNRKWELFASIIVSALFFAGTLESWIPFGPVMTFGENVKQSWEKNYASPPVAHMEEYTLSKLAESFPGISTDEMIKTLKDSSIRVKDPGDNLKSIALDNEVTPSRIYDILLSVYGKQQVSKTTSAPSGVGRMTISTVSGYLGMKPSDVISILEDNGIKANAETTMKTIADELGISPHDLYSLLSTD
jgi:hypothetical protein